MPGAGKRLASLVVVAATLAACSGGLGRPAATTTAPAPAGATAPPPTVAPPTPAPTVPPPPAPITTTTTAAPPPTTATTTTLPPPPPTVRVVLVGDIMLGRGVARTVAADPAAVFAGVLPINEAADLAAGNLESPLTTRPHIAINSNALEARPESAVALALGGFDLMSVANNHATDAGRVSVLDSIDAVRSAGLEAVGGGPDRPSAFTPVVVDRNGVAVGFLAFDVTLAGWPAQPDRPGVAHWDPALAEPVVRALRDRADVVVVSVHGGVEYRTATDRRMAGIAADLADWGADVVWGHGPHVVQPVYDIVAEDGRSVVVATSLGNFLFDMRADGTQTGAILEIEADSAGVIRYRVGLADHPERVVEFTGWLVPDGSDAEGWLRLRV